jgi:hypothetical protein
VRLATEGGGAVPAPAAAHVDHGLVDESCHSPPPRRV